MLSLFVLRPSASMKDCICGRNRHLKPNPTPDKAKSLYNAQQQFLVVQGQDKDLGTGSAIGVWGLCCPLQFQGPDDPSCVCLSFQLLLLCWILVLEMDQHGCPSSGPTKRSNSIIFIF